MPAKGRMNPEGIRLIKSALRYLEDTFIGIRPGTGIVLPENRGEWGAHMMLLDLLPFKDFRSFVEERSRQE